MRATPATLAFFAALAGCSTSASPGLDASVPGADAGATPSITPAALPVITPCQAGWRTSVLDGVETCEPWPETGRSDCASPDEAHFPGTPGCARVGTACPAGDFADDLPADRPIVYVLAGAPGGGDGTAARPFGRIADALTRVAEGGVVALGKGSYDQAIVPTRAATLWGACVRDTIVRSSISTTTPVVDLRGRAFELRNLQLGPSARVGVGAGAGAELTLRDVVIEQVTQHGIDAHDGGHVVGTSVVVRDVRPNASGAYGSGLQATTAARVELTRYAFESVRHSGVVGGGTGTVVVLDDGVIRDVASALATRDGGHGVDAFDGARVELHGSAVEAVREFALVAEGADTVVVVDGSILRDVLPAELDATGGRAVQAQRSASITLTRTVVSRTAEVGVMAASGTIDGDDVVISETGGHGLAALAGGSVRIGRVRVSRATEGGVVADGAGSVVALTDATVADTRSGADVREGRAAAAQAGGDLTLVRARLERSVAAAVTAFTGGSFTGTDLVIADSLANADGVFGDGIVVATAGRASLTRASIERTRGAGIIADGDGTAVELVDVAVRDTLSDDLDGMHGRGLMAQGGAHVIGTGVRVERAREVAVAATSPGTRLELTGLSVVGTRRALCAEDGRCDGAAAGGNALGAYDQASVVIHDFVLDGAALCGAQLAADGSLDLSQGAVRGCVIGACVQVPGYDIARLSNRVTFDGNERSLETTMLPVPGAYVGAWP